MTALKYTLRLWRKNLGVTIMAVLAMAFGIGLVTTQFSFMNGVLLRGLPFDDADRLVYLERKDLERRQHGLDDRTNKSEENAARGFRQREREVIRLCRHHDLRKTKW